MIDHARKLVTEIMYYRDCRGLILGDSVKTAFDKSMWRRVCDEQDETCPCCKRNLFHAWPGLSLHHRKKRSALTREDIEEHGPGGGRLNAVMLCCECHERVEANGVGKYAEFRTHFWQKIGERDV